VHTDTSETEDRPTATTTAGLYLALECARPGAGAIRVSLEQVREVQLGRRPAREVLTTGPSMVVGVPDARMSTDHARLTLEFGAWILEDRGSKNGTRLNGAPTTRALLMDQDVIEVGHSFFVFRAKEARVEGSNSDETLMPSLSKLLADLSAVAVTQVPIRIEGETGTGKERLAAWIHRRSGRAGALVAVNCGALVDSLVESALFGHARGAFSGAVEEHAGLVRGADRGTLFLDEIGDLSLQSQAALLRVLQEREVTAVGATRARKVDFRLLSATHRDLGALVATDGFRADLLGRLSGFTASLPPLRERKAELGLLVANLLHPNPGAARLQLSLEAGRALLRHDWPMNIRELAHAIELASALAMPRDGVVTLEQLPRELQVAHPPSSAAENADRRKELVALLEQHRGNVTQVAKAMGKARMQVQRWLKQHQLDPQTFRRSR